jgi:GT2 family glycosyltransferase
VTQGAPVRGPHQATQTERTHQPDTFVLPLASVIIVNTNERHHLERCLPSVCSQSYENYEVLVVDNESSDGSVEYIREAFPEVRIVPTGGNLGYPGANNLGFAHARGDYLAVLNPDTVVDHRWLEELIRALENNHSAGMATSKILLLDDPARINACGNDISPTGLTYCRGVNEPADHYPEPEYVSAVSGAAFAVRRSVVEEIGPFDAEFVAYLEETELSLRSHLAGYRALYVPASRALHDYTFRFGERKCFHIEKNRIYMLLKVFRARTLVLLIPLLLSTELMVWTYMFTQGRGHVRQKWRSYTWLWTNRQQIREQHERTQHIRKLPDKEILKLLVPRLPFHQLVGGAPGRALNRLSTAFISLMSRIPLRYAE